VEAARRRRILERTRGQSEHDDALEPRPPAVQGWSSLHPGGGAGGAGSAPGFIRARKDATNGSLHQEKEPFIDRHLIKKVEDMNRQNQKKVVKDVVRRRSTILSRPGGAHLRRATTGGKFHPGVSLTENMVGHKLGEFRPHPPPSNGHTGRQEGRSSPEPPALPGRGAWRSPAPRAPRPLAPAAPAAEVTEETRNMEAKASLRLSPHQPRAKVRGGGRT